jgi:uncharacterized protein YhaN
LSEDARKVEGQTKRQTLLTRFIAVEKLARGASGLRHLRWAREIYATLAAHVEHSDLVQEHKTALKKELVRLDKQLQNLSAAVKPYRDFLERERVKFRGAIRAAQLTDDTVRASSADPGNAQRTQVLEAEAMFQREALPKQRSLKANLEMAVAEMRAHLEEMDIRVAALTSEKFLTNLYPPLVTDRSRVADVPDDDDDASGVED